MKKYLYIHLLLSLFLLTTGCSDKFLEEKRDLGAVNEDVFIDPVLGQAYIDYVYGCFCRRTTKLVLCKQIPRQKMAPTIPYLPKLPTNWRERLILIRNGQTFPM